MPAKRKSNKTRASFHIKDEAPSEPKVTARPKVSQVVEVVEESTQPPAHVEVTENAKGTKITVDVPEQVSHEVVSQPEVSSPVSNDDSSLEEVTNPLDNEVSAPVEPSAESQAQKMATEEAPKQNTEVISDLFQKQEVQGYPEISMHKKGTNALIVWSVAMVTVAVLVGGALIFSSQSSVKLPSVFSGSVTPTPTLEPTPTPKTAARGDISVEVLNGSGKSGVGSKMKTLLEEKGYTVSNVGNADNYDYEKTTLKAKAGKEDYVTFLKTDLADDYAVDEEVGVLEDAASVDVQVIVGAE